MSCFHGYITQLVIQLHLNVYCWYVAHPKTDICSLFLPSLYLSHSLHIRQHPPMLRIPTTCHTTKYFNFTFVKQKTKEIKLLVFSLPRICFLVLILAFVSGENLVLNYSIIQETVANELFCLLQQNGQEYLCRKILVQMAVQFQWNNKAWTIVCAAFPTATNPHLCQW